VRQLAAVCAVAAVLGAPAIASAHHYGQPTVDHYVHSDGTGLLIAHEGSPTTPSAPSSRPPRTVRPSPASPGAAASSFRHRHRSRAICASAAFVRPLAAAWSGGWGREAERLQLQACTTPEGARCKVIVDEIKFGSCQPGGGRLLPARYEGFWLRVADRRIDRRQPFTLEGYSWPEGVGPNQGAPGVAVATVGRVGPGAAPATDCGRDSFAPPQATIRATIVRVAGRRLVTTTVRCPAACRVELRARQGSREVTVTRGLSKGTDVALPWAAARRLRPGRIGVRVRVDGRVVAERAATLRGRA